jgi:hypothetical protein
MEKFKIQHEMRSYMTIFTITGIKHFMSLLLSQEAFDQWLVSEITITTHNTFHMDGTLNKDFYGEDERPQGDKAPWSLLRPICFNIIKGQRTPSMMKLIFTMNPETTSGIIHEAGSIPPEDVNGLYVNMHYEGGRLTLTTGTSLRIFSMDKALDEALERYVSGFLTGNGIEYDC